MDVADNWIALAYALTNFSGIVLAWGPRPAAAPSRGGGNSTRGGISVNPIPMIPLPWRQFN